MSESVDHDQDGPAIIFSHGNPSILFLAMLFIKYGDGARVTKDCCRPLQAHLALPQILLRIRWVPLAIVPQWHARSFQTLLHSRFEFSLGARLSIRFCIHHTYLADLVLGLCALFFAQANRPGYTQRGR